MNFGENLQFLRDREGLTQEALAEQMEVSRQSVSKWESGGSYPEMDKLLTLCTLFQVDMDTLLRGDAKAASLEDRAGYDNYMKRRGMMIAGGVGLILLGIALMFLLGSIGLGEAKGIALFLSFVVISVVLFIVASMNHSVFEKKHPNIPDFYTQDDRDKNHRQTVALIAGGVAAVLLGVIWLVLTGDVPTSVTALEAEILENRSIGLFFLVLSLAVPALVYGGLLRDKCDLASWNWIHDQSPERQALRRKEGVVCGCIMMGATAIYLALGFGFMAFSGDYGNSLGWRWGWIVYPIAGILCGIAATIIERNEPQPM